MSDVGGVRVFVGCATLERSHVGASGAVVLVVSFWRPRMGRGRRKDGPRGGAGAARVKGRSAIAVRKNDACMMIDF